MRQIPHFPQPLPAFSEGETKHLDAPARSPELNAAFDDFMSAFESFKDANDERLAQIERKLTGDVITEEKVNRINESLTLQQKKLDNMMLDMKRPKLASSTHWERSERRQAFAAYIRGGHTAGLERAEQKDFSSAASSGGYFVPEELDQTIGGLMRSISAMRRLATVRHVSRGDYNKVVISAQGTNTAQWVAETAARSKTDTPTLQELSLSSGELYAMPAATPALLADSAIDVEQWLADEVFSDFAHKEGEAFVSGSGTNQPKGFLNYTIAANSESLAWNKIGYVASGGSTGLASSNPADALIDLAYALRPVYRANASWMMNRQTIATLRKLKDSNGNYIWQPPGFAAKTATLLNFPIVEDEKMPAIGANKHPIAFADFRAAYLIVDHGNVRVLRDPYSSKPYILFYTVKRVSGGMQDHGAMKLLKVATS